MKRIKEFFARIRRARNSRLVHREIYRKIFPHLRADADHGYPFRTDDDMLKLHIRARLQNRLDLELIERAVASMPRAYGEAFRYILYRDLNERMELYMEAAERYMQPETCDPRLTAVGA